MKLHIALTKWNIIICRRFLFYIVCSICCANFWDLFKLYYIQQRLIEQSSSIIQDEQIDGLHAIFEIYRQVRTFYFIQLLCYHRWKKCLNLRWKTLHSLSHYWKLSFNPIVEVLGEHLCFSLQMWTFMQYLGGKFWLSH